VCAGSFREAQVASELGLSDDQVEFVMRLWLEEGDGARFWRGSVQEIESGLVAHFQDGRALLRFLNARLVARSGIPLARGQAGEQPQSAKA
jgi:hypothetical protein